MAGRSKARQRFLAGFALGLVALIAELAGRSLTHRLDVGRRVGHVSYAHTDYYPFLLAGVKIAVALMLAHLAWRIAKAHAARRLAAALGVRPVRRAPRVRIELSARLWFLSFAVTASIYLVQADAEQIAAGSWHLLGPWLHSSALPVFAVLSVVVAVVFRTVALWLSDYEELAADALALVRRLTTSSLGASRSLFSAGRAPRALFGLAFESRPPPVVV